LTIGITTGDDLDFLGLDDDGGKPKISKKKQGKTDKKAFEVEHVCLSLFNVYTFRGTSDAARQAPKGIMIRRDSKD
jgi:hypothetical protein